MGKRSFYSLTKEALEKELAQGFDHTKAKLRAKEIFLEVYKNPQFLKGSFFPQIHQDVRQWLDSTFNFEPSMRIEKFSVSEQDGSVKFILASTSDRQLVEAVLIPERKRLTLCVSTQVGCAQGCRFCHTGWLGLTRHLTTEEVVDQFRVVDSWRRSQPHLDVSSYSSITNVVFMGMGEPLDNVDAVEKSVLIFCDPHGFFLSHHRVTVSTVGILPALQQILTQTKASIAISLHSPFDAERSKIMPVNQRHPIAKVIDECCQAMESQLRKSFMIQYILLRGVNDSSAHAQELSRLLKGFPFKVNLIPLNEHEATAYRRPDLNHVYRFQQHLKSEGLVSTVRLSKGRDIQAACGQLVAAEDLSK